MTVYLRDTPRRDGRADAIRHLRDTLRRDGRADAIRHLRGTPGPKGGRT
ncbi:hypothetical protein [Streptomyces sp. NPDC093225]